MIYPESQRIDSLVPSAGRSSENPLVVIHEKDEERFLTAAREMTVGWDVEKDAAMNRAAEACESRFLVVLRMTKQGGRNRRGGRPGGVLPFER